MQFVSRSASARSKASISSGWVCGRTAFICCGRLRMIQLLAPRVSVRMSW